ncbi:unnamed protein product [Peronospora destructor]|uniref:Uncharacterized protein n=1 Tax=Peronospora destructor TaxID=86335 RepID=A0AAV0UUG4_9STRA|nr:unnamed protein product [Peronospora destructor]
MLESTRTETPSDDQEEDTYLAQRQSTMDSATLDKLLKAEKNLTQAGQATSNVWKLIGKLPSDESESPPPPPPAQAAHVTKRVPLISQSSRSTVNYSASQNVGIKSTTSF